MANARHDENSVPSQIAVLNTDGKTITPLLANPLTNYLKVNDGTTGTAYGYTNAMRDDNDVPTMLALSSADLKTIIPLQADSLGKLLIKST
jgi:hypothetical protein